MLFAEGLPIFLLELAIGQRLRKGAIGVWKQISPYLGGIGIASGVVSFNVALYYNTIIAWCLFYFGNVSERTKYLLIYRLTWHLDAEFHLTSAMVIMSRGDLCQWNCSYRRRMRGKTCLLTNIIYGWKSLKSRFPGERQRNCIHNLLFYPQASSPTQYFWYRKTLDVSTDIETADNFNLQIGGTLLISWILIYACMVQGITGSPFTSVSSHGD